MHLIFLLRSSSFFLRWLILVTVFEKHIFSVFSILDLEGKINQMILFMVQERGRSKLGQKSSVCEFFWSGKKGLNQMK